MSHGELSTMPQGYTIELKISRKPLLKISAIIATKISFAASRAFRPSS